MELQVGVKIILQNKEGKFLMLLRSLETKPTPHREYWDMPGGRINIGTSLIENLKREILEETSLELVGELKLIMAQDILKDKHVVRLTYSGFAGGEVKLSEEHSQYKWFTKQELSTLEPIDSYFKEVFNEGNF